MKNFFLVAFALFSFSAFAQREMYPPDDDLLPCRFIVYEFFKCDSNGQLITDRNNPNYIKYKIAICQGGIKGVRTTVLREDVAREICMTGTFRQTQSVVLIETEHPFFSPGLALPPL